MAKFVPNHSLAILKYIGTEALRNISISLLFMYVLCNFVPFGEVMLRPICWILNQIRFSLSTQSAECFYSITASSTFFGRRSIRIKVDIFLAKKQTRGRNVVEDKWNKFYVLLHYLVFGFGPYNTLFEKRWTFVGKRKRNE